MNDPKSNQSYEIRNIYLKDLSFESPHSPNIFRGKLESPRIDIDVKINHQAIENTDNAYETVLTLKVNAYADEQLIFLIEVQQAGIVVLSGFADAQIEQILNIGLPNAILPYLRETISNVVNRGGFPQLVIQPLNFESIYREKLRLRQKEQEKAKDTVKH